MAEKSTPVHIGENSPEQVAYKLFEHVVSIEGMALHQNPDRRTAATRKWMLDAYAECLGAVRGHRDWKEG